MAPTDPTIPLLAQRIKEREAWAKAVFVNNPEKLKGYLECLEDAHALIAKGDWRRDSSEDESVEEKVRKFRDELVLHNSYFPLNPSNAFARAVLHGIDALIAAVNRRT